MAPQQGAETLVTGEDGATGESGQLRAGTWWVREVKAPQGYALDAEPHALEVRANETTTLQLSDLPQNDPNGMGVQKLDSATGKASPQGAGTLAGAEFTVRYYAGYYDSEAALPAKATRTWVLRTDADGATSLYAAKVDPDTYLVSGDDFYTSSNGKYTIPLGTVTVEETRAPRGYLLPEGGARTLHVIRGAGDSEWVYVLNEAEVREDVARGDVAFNKAALPSNQRLGSVAFLVTSATTGERHVVVTDGNGSFDSSASWVPHEAHADGQGNRHETNANDAALADDGRSLRDGATLDPLSGTWFYGSAKDASAKPDDSRGAPT